MTQDEINDQLGDDTGGEESGQLSKSVDAEPKPNRAKKPNKPPARKPASPKQAQEEETAAAADNFTPRARALQESARAKAGEQRRRIGQTVKCPGCQIPLHVDKTILDDRKNQVARWLVCKNEKCNYRRTKGRAYRKQVAVTSSVLNEEEDLGVMSDRQRAHVAK
jgi:hypothetical protein